MVTGVRCQRTVTTATVTDYHCSCSESSYLMEQCLPIGKVFDERGLDHHRIIIKFEKFQKKNGVINSYSVIYRIQPQLVYDGAHEKMKTLQTLVLLG